MIAGRKEETNDSAGEDGLAANVTELAMIHNHKCDKRQSHSQEIEKKRRDVLKGVFYQDEGRPPDEHDRQKQEVSQGCGAESMSQLVIRSGLRFTG